MNRQLLTSMLVAAALIAGAAGGYWYALQRGTGRAAPAPVQAERKPLFYRNAMNPQITSPVPARDEMGMDYVPVYADAPEPGDGGKPEILFYRNPMNPEITSPVPAKDDMGMDYVPVHAPGAKRGGEPAGTVEIDPVTEQNIGVRTAVAERRTLARTVRTVGRVAYNEELIARIHPKIEGWIETLFVDQTGVRIKRDTILLELYSPQLVASQQEYLLALKSAETLSKSSFEDIGRGAQDLVKSSRQRLELLDVPEHQIRELENTRKIKKTLHIHSPYAGVVVNIGAREGQFVTPQTELYMLADLSKIWVIADVYEDDLPWVAEGDPARMQVAGILGETFEGRIAYIYPYLDNRTRTVKVRLEYDNPKMTLKPDMFANVELLGGRQVDAVAVPAEAIVRSGQRNQVFVVRDRGKFEPREVTIGVTTDGMTQILTGLDAGERVVTSSQFLIDSESKLREATAKMLEVSAAKAPSPGAEPLPAGTQSMNEHRGMGTQEGHEAVSGDRAAAGAGAGHAGHGDDEPPGPVAADGAVHRHD